MPCLRTCLKKLNHINPHNSKKNYKLVKVVLGLLIVSSLIFRVSQNLAQELPNTTSLEEIARQEDANATARENPSAESWGELSIVNTGQVIAEGLIGRSTFDEESGQVSYLFGGVASATTDLIAKATTPPISGVQYLAQLTDNILGKPVYAQTGVGFQGLQPLLPIWKVFRNIIYILSSLFFIILGIMIMFRLKINPQTVLTVQNAIPKVFVTLLLVTLSYAIAGLLIDLTYVIQNLVLATIFTSTGTSLSDNLFPSKYVVGTTNSFAKLTDAGFWDIWRLTHLALPSWTINITALLVSTIVGIISGTPIGILVTFVIIKLVMAIIIVSSLVKFFFGILKTYINILLKIILAPLEIGIGVFPGIQIGFSTWFKELFANLIVFPICLLLLVIANLIIELTSKGVWGPNMITGNILSAIATPFVGVSGGLVPVAVGFGTLLLLPKLPELIPQLVFQIKPSAWSSAIGERSQTTFGRTASLAKSSTMFRLGGLIKKGSRDVQAPRAGRLVEKAADKLTRSGDSQVVRDSLGDAVANLGKT